MHSLTSAPLVMSDSTSAYPPHGPPKELTFTINELVAALKLIRDQNGEYLELFSAGLI